MLDGRGFRGQRQLGAKAYCPWPFGKERAEQTPATVSSALYADPARNSYLNIRLAHDVLDVCFCRHLYFDYKVFSKYEA
jgi:hypothetical protein